MKLHRLLRNETKSYYRFERRDSNGNIMSLYIRQADIKEAGIDPHKGIVITVEEAP